MSDSFLILKRIRSHFRLNTNPYDAHKDLILYTCEILNTINSLTDNTEKKNALDKYLRDSKYPYTVLLALASKTRATTQNGWSFNDWITSYNKLIMDMFSIIKTYCNYVEKSYQQEYIKCVTNILAENNRVLMVAPTGAGKTYMCMNIINSILTTERSNIVLFMSPRVIINTQCVDIEYLSLCNKPFHPVIINTYKETKLQEQLIKLKLYIDSGLNIFISSTFQSKERILSLIREYNITIDICILDEAHMMKREITVDTNWCHLLNNSNITKYLFITATPTPEQIQNIQMYGTCIKKTTVGKLIKSYNLAPVIPIICNVRGDLSLSKEKKITTCDKATIIKRVIKIHSPKKMLVFVNTEENGIALYNELKKQNSHMTEQKLFTYFGKNTEENKNAEKFDKFIKTNTSTETVICISCRKLGCGFNDKHIDAVVFADQRGSIEDINQCCGRCYRYIPNKVAYVVVLYDSYVKNHKMLNTFLDYLKNEEIIHTDYKTEITKPGFNYLIDPFAELKNISFIYKSNSVYDGIKLTTPKVNTTTAASIPNSKRTDGGCEFSVGGPLKNKVSKRSKVVAVNKVTHTTNTPQTNTPQTNTPQTNTPQTNTIFKTNLIFNFEKLFANLINFNSNKTSKGNSSLIIENNDIQSDSDEYYSASE